MAEPIVMCFSGGKDSSLALQAIQQEGRYDVVALLTTVTSDYDRVSMHGVRRALLHQQTASLGLSLTEVAISPMSSNDIYSLSASSSGRWRGVIERKSQMPWRSGWPHGVRGAVCSRTFGSISRRTPSSSSAAIRTSRGYSARLA